MKISETRLGELTEYAKGCRTMGLKVKITPDEAESLAACARFVQAVDWEDVEAMLAGSWRSSAPHVIYSKRKTASLALADALKALREKETTDAE
jgi:hypothetical protein